MRFLVDCSALLQYVASRLFYQVLLMEVSGIDVVPSLSGLLQF